MRHSVSLNGTKINGTISQSDLENGTTTKWYHLGEMSITRRAIGLVSERRGRDLSPEGRADDPFEER